MASQLVVYHENFPEYRVFTFYSEEERTLTNGNYLKLVIHPTETVYQKPSTPKTSYEICIELKNENYVLKNFERYRKTIEYFQGNAVATSTPSCLPGFRCG